MTCGCSTGNWGRKRGTLISVIAHVNKIKLGNAILGCHEQVLQRKTFKGHIERLLEDINLSGIFRCHLKLLKSF